MKTEQTRKKHPVILAFISIVLATIIGGTLFYFTTSKPDGYRVNIGSAYTVAIEKDDWLVEKPDSETTIIASKKAPTYIGFRYSNKINYSSLGTTESLKEYLKSNETDAANFKIDSIDEKDYEKFKCMVLHVTYDGKTNDESSNGIKAYCSIDDQGVMQLEIGSSKSKIYVENGLDIAIAILKTAKKK